MSGAATSDIKEAPQSARAPRRKKSILDVNVTDIANRERRLEVYQRQRKAKAEIKADERKRKKREKDVLGDAAPPMKIPKTIESEREYDHTTVDPDDEEIKGEEEMDEFADYFKRSGPGAVPRLCLTTSIKPGREAYDFIKEILFVFPNSFFYPRRRLGVPQMVQECIGNGFTDLLIFNWNLGRVDGLTVIHLPGGPTANFRMSNVRLNREIRGSAKLGQISKPEVILNRFTTRIGQRVGRLLAALFQPDPYFKGRRVMTFHNQRDFIFFRHHRYTFWKLGDVDAKSDGSQMIRTKGGKLRYPAGTKPIKGTGKVSKHRLEKLKAAGAENVFKTFRKGSQAHRDATRDKPKLLEGETIIHGSKIVARLQEVGPQFTLRLRWMQHGILDRDAGEYEWKQNKDMGKSRRKFSL